MTENIGTYMRQKFEERLAKLDPARWNVRDIHILYEISGEDGGAWTVAIENGKGAFLDGAVPTPDVTITGTSEHMRAMIDGKLNPLTAQLQGKIQFKGNTTLLLKLKQILS